MLINEHCEDGPIRPSVRHCTTPIAVIYGCLVPPSLKAACGAKIVYGAPDLCFIRIV